MSTYEVVLESEFSAAHRLRMHDGQYEPLHGHNWRVEVFLERRTLDSAGLVADFSVLHRNLSEITAGLHDTCLNELPAFAERNPSAERVAEHLHDRYKPTLPPEVRVAKVRVWETRQCAAGYRPADIRTEEADRT